MPYRAQQTGHTLERVRRHHVARDVERQHVAVVRRTESRGNEAAGPPGMPQAVVGARVVQRVRRAGKLVRPPSAASSRGICNQCCPNGELSFRAEKCYNFDVFVTGQKALRRGRGHACLLKRRAPRPAVAKGLAKVWPCRAWDKHFRHMAHRDYGSLSRLTL